MGSPIEPLAREAMGDRAAAIHGLQQAAREARRLRAPGLEMRFLCHLAEMRLAAGDTGRALMTAQQVVEGLEDLLGGLGEEEGTTAREQFAVAFEVGASAAARLEEPEEIVRFLESGRAGSLLETLGGRRILRWDDLPERLRGDEAAAQAEEARARHAHARALEGRRVREIRTTVEALHQAMDAVRDVNARIQREAKRQAGLFYPRAETIEAIESFARRPHQALVLYGLCGGGALALVLTSRRASGSWSSGSAATDDEGRRARSTSTQPTVTPTPPTALAMPCGACSSSLSSLGEDVDAGARSRRRVRSATCPSGRSSRTARSRSTPSGTTLRAPARGGARARASGILALGDPDYAGVSTGRRRRSTTRRPRRSVPIPAHAPRGRVDRRRSTLLGARGERGRRCAKAIAERRSAGGPSTLPATGSSIVERPMLSSLALSTQAGKEDGFLTALEVLRMEIPADLAVLSACETGRPGRSSREKGIVGLTRAFMYAGRTARSLLALGRWTTRPPTR